MRYIPGGWERTKPDVPGMGLSVECAECGRLVSYDHAIIHPAMALKFFHETCAQQVAEQSNQARRS